MPAQPATSITDFLLAAAGLGLGTARLRQPSPLAAPRLWGLGLLLGGAAALAGAIFHGWAPALSPAFRDELWTAILVLIGASAGILAAGAVAMPRSRQRWRWLVTGLAISGAALAVQLSGWAPLGLNHNAWFHLAEIAAFFCFYRASLPRCAVKATTGSDSRW